MNVQAPLDLVMASAAELVMKTTLERMIQTPLGRALYAPLAPPGHAYTTTKSVAADAEPPRSTFV
jgi:hypothetical protein